MMESDLLFVELVDSIVRDFAEKGIPQNSLVVARVLAEVFCKGFNAAQWRACFQQIEAVVFERMSLDHERRKAGAAKQRQN
jgi:hypothetical protein